MPIQAGRGARRTSGDSGLVLSDRNDAEPVQTIPMLTSELEQLLRVAPPGTQVEILRITIPGPNAPAPDPPVDSSEPAKTWNAEAVVEWVRREYGGDGLKLKEWSGMLPGISHRELVRAAGDGRLPTHSKRSGKDHGARLASPDAMLSFLATHEVPA